MGPVGLRSARDRRPSTTARAEGDTCGRDHRASQPLTPCCRPRWPGGPRTSACARRGLDAVSLFALAFLAGAFISLGAIFATTVGPGAGDLPLRRRAPARRARVLARPDPRHRRRRRAVHRQQPDRDGLGEPQGQRRPGAPELGDRLRRQPGRGARHGRRHVPVRAVHVRQRQRRVRRRSRSGTRRPASTSCRRSPSGCCATPWSAWRSGSTFSARTTTDRILAIVPPIAAFVAVGFEHCVANMYFIPRRSRSAWSRRTSFWTAIGKTPADFPEPDRRGLHRQPRAGDHREHHRRRADGRHRLLVHLPARADRLIGARMIRVRASASRTRCRRPPTSSSSVVASPARATPSSCARPGCRSWSWSGAASSRA